MARITDYSTLQTAVENMVHRSDISTYFDQLLQGAENRLYSDILTLGRGKGLSVMEKSYSGTIASNAVPVPTDYLAMKYVYVLANSQAYMLERKDPEWVYRNYPNLSAQQLPIYFARSGTDFIFAPYADSNYPVDGVYYAKAPALTSTSTTNWMVTDYPNLILYATLLETATFLEDEQKAQLYGTLYQQKLKAAVNADKYARHSGSPLAMLPG